MNIIDVIDSIGDVIENVERTISVLAEAQRYFETPIQPGTGEAICLVDSSSQINNLLGVVNEGLYTITPELDKAVKDLNVYKRGILEPAPKDLTAFIEEASHAVAKAKNLLDEYMLELKNYDRDGQTYDIVTEFLLVKGGIITCVDLMYSCLDDYLKAAQKKNITK